MTSFDNGRVAVANESRKIDYDLEPRRERFYVHVPQGYTERADYGLVVYIHPGDQITEEPQGWAALLDARKLLFIAPQNAGNEQDVARRLGLAVLSATAMMHRYRIDPARVYVAGWSGGARMAGLVAFFQPDLFHGTIQSCGADFYLHVPQIFATSEADTNGNPYGFFDASSAEIENAKRQVRFALITGSNDFRHGNVLDIFNGGFAKAGFRARLFDVPGMGHAPAEATVLASALSFVDARD